MALDPESESFDLPKTLDYISIGNLHFEAWGGSNREMDLEEQAWIQEVMCTS